jgi:predicted ArsR family transcriptional regulator
MERRAATHDEARALANPLRLRILRLCLDRSMTNEELAERLGLNAGTMLHHVRLLVATGFLAPEEERRGARGSVERPYRATGKSWTLDVGEEEWSGKTNAGTLALIDAFRAEVAEVPVEYLMTGARLGVRLTADQLEAFRGRIEALTRDLKDADDPAGEPYGFFVGLHRRAE